MITLLNKNLDLFDQLWDEKVDFLDVFKNKNELGSTNVEETNDYFKLEILLPGYKKNEIDIEIDDNYLNISAEVEQKNKNYNRQEFFKKSFERKFNLPENIKDEIKAEMNDGILNITLFKKEKELKNKKIEIL